MDFYRIKRRMVKRDGVEVIEVYPDFIVGRSKDLMVQGRSFYAVWDDYQHLWSTDEYDVQRLVDASLDRYVQEHVKQEDHARVDVKYMADFSSNSWKNFRNYLYNISDSAKPLDDVVTFADAKVTKDDYVSKKLPYDVAEGEPTAYLELMETIYDSSEMDKLEWAMGSIFVGDGKNIQKFLVLYGEAGAGKSTFLNILQKLFEGYYTTFEAKALTGSNNSFAMEAFRSNPLVAIQHDGDLSRIEDNTKLNSIVSHEEMTMNEKFKASYMVRLNAFLFMGTNRPVKITDAKSGIIRRLIDVQPSGRRVSPERYFNLVSQINFELGSIARRCIEKYHRMGQNYYSDYVPVEMMLQTDVFYNYIENYFDIFNSEPGVTLERAYEMYKTYCEDTSVEYRLPRYRFREELKNYFGKFHDRYNLGGERVRSYYSDFKSDKFLGSLGEEDEVPTIELELLPSELDAWLSEMPAQYATVQGSPSYRWDRVRSKLKDLDTGKLHYVKVPENHIVIDFDLKEDGEKSLSRNLEEASKWPPTYTEVSRSGNGLHLHYIYDGDASQLKTQYDDDIEVKVYSGHASLRRQLTLNNGLELAHISSGLPKKEEKMLDVNKMTSERGVRDLIARNLRKEIHPGTKPSIDFINKILNDAKDSGMEYDVRDMRNDILAFATTSTNQAPYCMKVVSEMPFYSGEAEEIDFYGTDITAEIVDDSRPIVFFDLEVYPNLFYISWKMEGDDKPMHHMFNPTPEEVERLLKMRLVGFNNRHYDNHILYARYMGYDNEALFRLSQNIIVHKSQNAKFSQAYGLSYADIFDFSSKKQSLKKFEIDLGLKHMELDLPWDEPVPEDKWELVAEYCDTDVMATEAVWDDRKQDFLAREILAELSGLRVNDTTRQHVSKIIFGDNRNPQDAFVYTDLSEMFPGYQYSFGKSIYRGEEVGEGGYVYAEPGMYENVVVFDIVSMHPTSIEELDLFGKYTSKFSDLKDARVAIKNGKYDEARKMMDGRLEPYLTDRNDADKLADALKIVINSVYGLTSARFPNPFKDKRNVDNIVAKRGALFMVDLKNKLQENGVEVIHIKTDSIKISNPDQETIDFIFGFGEEYGYEFDIEETYSKMCLVNDAVYVAHVEPVVEGEKPFWKAVGAQFKQPYVFKKLFSKEPIEFPDLCETKSVTTAMYLDLNENLPEGEHNYRFIGRVGSFCPMGEGVGAGVLLREKDGKFYAVGGTKGYRWLESNIVQNLGLEPQIDYGYFETLTDKALSTIEEYGDYSWLIS